MPKFDVDDLFEAVWTEARVRDELPDVPVEGPSGRTYKGTVRGRQNSFATVSFGPQGLIKQWVIEVRWDVIALVLNNIAAGDKAARVTY